MSDQRRRPAIWRTLEERMGDPAFQAFLHDEFPSQVEAITDPVARRTFLKLMGASMALAGATACTRQPVEKIVPYVRQPEEIVPGRPLFFATAMAIGGTASGILVESHEGRPTKIEGNPLHPSSLGATDVYAQAAILGLYDPDRSKTLTNLGDIRPWSAFLGAIRAALISQQPFNGAGVRLLTESVNSPTLAAQIRDVLTRYPSARWHQWDPASREPARAGARMAFGEYVDAQYHLDRADVVLALDADFLACGAGSLRYAREFAARRRPGDRMNRFYAIETMPSPGGARADHRLAVKPSEMIPVARAIATRLGRDMSIASGGGDAAASGTAIGTFVDAVARDLAAHRGRSLVVAGDHQPAEIHAIAHAMNAALGNAGATVIYTDPVEAEPVSQIDSLRELVADMNAGTVDLLVILGGNPVFTAPPDVRFAEALAKVQLRAHLSLYEDETSALCHWQIPEAHFLESWSDARGHDGTASIVQPLIAPLYGGRSAHEMIAAFSDRPERSPYEIVREHWKVDPKNDTAWRKWLHDGVIPDTAFAAKRVSVTGNLANLSNQANPASPPNQANPANRPNQANPANPPNQANLANPANPANLDLSFRLDPCILDGRFANNGWLQELPKPITKLTWDNAIFVSPATAAQLSGLNRPAYRGGEHGTITSDVFEIRLNGQTVRGPLFVVPGHADGCATVHLGYGRVRGGQTASGAGFDVNRLRTADTLAFARDAQLVRTGDTYPLACTQFHHLMEGRDLIHAATNQAYADDPHVMNEGDETPPRTITLYPEYRYEGYKWGMAIDVNACIGCNACIVGCQAENNIPVVGKDQVLRGREMHWLRVDTYHSGETANPQTYFQPLPCMHCENAPCEPVCPVGATVHSHEGLNDMVYNRCVGTRYCSNNCPYKVRRFNYFLYQDWETPSLRLARNPDVSVRSRGVMEKCTYCVQRINAAKIESEKENRPVRDGEIQTACQQACPADAIVFGNLNDPNSRAAKLQAEARSYALLGELNTRPRTIYLGAVRNVNPELGE